MPYTVKADQEYSFRNIHNNTQNNQEKEINNKQIYN